MHLATVFHPFEQHSRNVEEAFAVLRQCNETIQVTEGAVIVMVGLFESLPNKGTANKGKRRFGRNKGKGADQAPEVQYPTQHEVARPKRQVPPVLKRTYGSLHTLLRVLQPVNAIVVLGIMVAFITTLDGWYLFSLRGVGIGLGLVVVELALFSQVWKHYQRATPEQSKHLIIMGFFALLMLAAAGAAVYRWQDHLWSVLLVLATVVASADPMEVASDNAEKRSIREEMEAVYADKMAAADANLRSANDILQQANTLVPGINGAFDKSNEATANATTLIGVLGDQEAAHARQVAAQVAADKPALIAQIRSEEQNKARTWAEGEVNRVSQELQQQFAQMHQQSSPSQPASVPSATPSPTSLPGYPGAPSQHAGSVPASDDLVQGQVTRHN